MTKHFPDLRRPQYPSSPEVLLSELAWSVIARRPNNETKKVGLIYERFAAPPKQLIILQTKPTGAGVEDFGKSLAAEGFSALGGERHQEVGEAVANSLQGVKPDKGAGRSSSAIGVASALLQDATGGLAAANPPNFAQLINSIYELGDSNAGESASTLWFEAAKHHSRLPGLDKIERALVSSTVGRLADCPGEWPPNSPKLKAEALGKGPPAWWKAEFARQGGVTPFHWFRDSWQRLCSPAWYERLPPRRWSSWAICVLRHGLAFSFLWEANFYAEIARGILGAEFDGDAVARSAVVPARPLMPHRRGSVSELNVAPSINKALAIGLACQDVIDEIATGFDDQPSLSVLLEALRSGASDDHRRRLMLALAGPSLGSRLGNLQETVKYSLLARGSAADGSTDHYGMLRTVSRNFTHVIPGAEWIVVMSAMAASSPSSIVRLGDVMQSMKHLGFQPRMDFILSELERAGLCASSPDGDEGIEINLGFGRN